MKITDLLKRESVELSRTPESKGQAIDQMVELMAKEEISTIYSVIKKVC